MTYSPRSLRDPDDYLRPRPEDVGGERPPRLHPVDQLPPEAQGLPAAHQQLLAADLAAERRGQPRMYQLLPGPRLAPLR